MKSSFWERALILLLVVVTKCLFDPISAAGVTYGTGDNMIFSLIGQGWTDGVIPFRDLFDHKGPILFLFYAVAAMIKKGLIGVAIVTTINLTIVLYLVLSISRLLLKDAKRIIHYIIVVLALVFIQLTHWSPGLSEELSLVFILLPLYLTIKFVESGRAINQHPYVYSFIYGLCFAVISFIRINNAVINVGLVLGFIFLLVRGRYYKAIAYNALFCLLGFMSVLVPLLIYFHYHDALYEMIYATFIFNLKYKVVDLSCYEQHLFKNVIWLTPCVYLSIISYYRDKKRGGIYSYFTIPASIVCILSFLDGYTFIHYFVNLLPYFILSAIFTIHLLKDKRPLIVTLTIVAMLSLYYEGAFSNIKTLYYKTPIAKNSERVVTRNDAKLRGIKMFSIIPKEDYNSIYSYESGIICQEYIRNSVYPQGKYFVFKGVHEIIDEKVKCELDTFHLTSDVKWIVSNVTADALPDGTFKTMLNRYDLIYNDTIIGLNLYKQSN